MTATEIRAHGGGCACKIPPGELESVVAGLLGSGVVSAVIDAGAVPYLDEARAALVAGHVSGGTRRNLDWVRPHLTSTVDSDELLLADAEISGALLVAGEVSGAPVIGVPRGEHALSVR